VQALASSSQAGLLCREVRRGALFPVVDFRRGDATVTIFSESLALGQSTQAFILLAFLPIRGCAILRLPNYEFRECLAIFADPKWTMQPSAALAVAPSRNCTRKRSAP
jgi:hypothetical protein